MWHRNKLYMENNITCYYLVQGIIVSNSYLADVLTNFCRTRDALLEMLKPKHSVFFKKSGLQAF